MYAHYFIVDSWFYPTQLSLNAVFVFGISHYSLFFLSNSLKQKQANFSVSCFSILVLKRIFSPLKINK